jgi:hypothetical protein
MIRKLDETESRRCSPGIGMPIAVSSVSAKNQTRFHRLENLSPRHIFDLDIEKIEDLCMEISCVSQLGISSHKLKTHFQVRLLWWEGQKDRRQGSAKLLHASFSGGIFSNN